MSGSMRDLISVEAEQDDEEDDDKDSEVCAIPLIFPFVYLR